MIDLTPFCGNDTHYRFSHEFIQGGWRIGTDGRICVRVPAQGAADSPGELPDTIGRLLWGQEGKAVLIVVRDDHRDCSTCDGAGKVLSRCPACQARIPPAVDCPSCGGSGSFDYPEKVELGGRWFLGKYLRLLQTLPNVMLILPADEDMEISTPGLFRFDGGEALLQPIDPPDACSLTPEADRGAAEKGDDD